MGQSFQRRIEDFACAHCGVAVAGNGYTNHCTACLHSLHVDVNPGDRSAGCRGLMEPIAVEQTGSRFVILHKCGACGFERRNRTSPDDSLDAILAVMRNAFHR